MKILLFASVLISISSVGSATVPRPFCVISTVSEKVDFSVCGLVGSHGEELRELAVILRSDSSIRATYGSSSTDSNERRELINSKIDSCDFNLSKLGLIKNQITDLLIDYSNTKESKNPNTLQEANDLVRRICGIPRA